MIIKNLFILFLVSVSLAACGRRSPLQQLEPNGYPHYYPKPIVEGFDGKKITPLENNMQSDSANMSEFHNPRDNGFINGVNNPFDNGFSHERLRNF